MKKLIIVIAIFSWAFYNYGFAVRQGKAKSPKTHVKRFLK